MIIISKHRHHFVAIPIHTYSNEGVKDNKPPAEYAGIRDFYDPDPYPSQGHTPNILAIKLPECPVNCNLANFKWSCNAHLTYPLSFDKHIECEIIGQIATENDMNNLLMAYHFPGYTMVNNLQTQMQQMMYAQQMQALQAIQANQPPGNQLPGNQQPGNQPPGNQPPPAPPL